MHHKQTNTTAANKSSHIRTVQSCKASAGNDRMAGPKRVVVSGKNLTIYVKRSPR